MSYEYLRGNALVAKVARGEYIEPGVNDTSPEVLDARGHAILEVTSKPFARLAGATVIEVPVSERHIPLAHKVLNIVTRNI